MPVADMPVAEQHLYRRGTRLWQMVLECSALRPRVYQFVQCWSSVLKCDVL